MMFIISFIGCLNGVNYLIYRLFEGFATYLTEGCARLARIAKTYAVYFDEYFWQPIC
jgi:hypothetical protein